MYQRDVNEIKAFVKWRGPDALVNNGLFVLLTIQAGLSTVRGSMVKVERDGYRADCLWGKKAEGYEYLNAHKDYLYGKLYHIADKYGYESKQGCIQAIRLFVDVPNFGMVKAAFMAQCLGFDTACLDVHNLKRFGIPVSATKINMKAKEATILRKIEDYVHLCHQYAEHGDDPQMSTAEYWWNTWCEYVAGNRANRALDTGDVVSRYHVECVTYGFEHG
jgi:hypothetical protein